MELEYSKKGKIRFCWDKICPVEVLDCAFQDDRWLSRMRMSLLLVDLCNVDVGDNIDHEFQ